ERTVGAVLGAPPEHAQPLVLGEGGGNPCAGERERAHADRKQRPPANDSRRHLFSSRLPAPRSDRIPPAPSSPDSRIFASRRHQNHAGSPERGAGRQAPPHEIFLILRSVAKRRAAPFETPPCG